jgi:diguanylate cyclase (GGDEF)-like protein
MENKVKRSGFTPQEHLVPILPIVLAGVVLLAATTASSLVNFQFEDPRQKTWLVICGFLGALHFAFYYFIHKIETKKTRYVWVNTLVAGVTLCLLSYFLPPEIKHMVYIMVFMLALPAALLANRGPSHIMLFGVTTFHLIPSLVRGLPPHELLTHIGFTATAFIGIETIQRLKNIAAQRIKRLEIINELSKHIISTLDTEQVFALLNTAFRSALKADSYYIGIIDGEQIRLELFYDDGVSIPGIQLDKKGTLSNWVITHQKGLFLPDLRQEVELDDVEIITIGKDKPTLSWMGVPMRGRYVDGNMAISSYHPNAFDRSDMELLNNIAQRAALALDNTYQHALVEKQAQLDSLTGVYNHGYFIQSLQKQAEACHEQNQPLSLIMLDIDYFKQYNDTFGHRVGDEVLISLCNIIRQHIKTTDAVGRWGGEEFCISLPNTNGQQATQVANRIRETMSTLKVKNAEQLTIPIPTVSQGIAIFPLETEEITRLIDLADKRLYIAKERGRDQVESAPALS